jgi:homoserine kinase type II
MVSSQAPKLEMLWEAHDPHSVLAERFGFTDASSANSWVTATVYEHWGLRIESCERIVMSGRNALAWISTPAGRLLAKWSVAAEQFTRLSQIARLTQWLDRKGLPVSAPIPSLVGEPQVQVDEVSMCLQRVIPGDLLDVDDDDQVRAAGAMLARLHQTLEGYPDADPLSSCGTQPRPLAARVADWMHSAGQRIPTAARDTLMRLVTDTPDDGLPTQLVHGDFRSSNVLCAGAKVAAVIDFEAVRADHCINETARSAVMLGTRFRGWGPVSAQVHATFLSGYQSVRQLTPVEESWWDVLRLWHTFAQVPPGDDPTGWGPSALSHLAQLAGSA